MAVSIFFAIGLVVFVLVANGVFQSETVMIGQAVNGVGAVAMIFIKQVTRAHKASRKLAD